MHGWTEESYRELLEADRAVGAGIAPADVVARVLARRREADSTKTFREDLASAMGVDAVAPFDLETESAPATVLQDRGVSLPLREALARTMPGAARELAREGVPTRTPLRRMPPHRYIDLEAIGEGGMGQVFLALDTELNREVALKLVRDPEASPELAPRFLQEAWVMGGLEHPSILPVHEVGETGDGVPYYSMPFVKGARTFRQALLEAAEQPLERRLVLLEPFLKVCDALAFAHARGVCHRDVKPENVALGEFGEVFVLDWGLARVRPASDEDATPWHHRIRDLRDEANLATATQALGTPGYMSPEALLRRTDELDARSDVYSLGVMLYEILTGRRPFAGEGLAEYVARTLREDPPPPAAVETAVPHALDALCRSALARDPAARPANAGALARGLRDWQARSALEREVESHLDRARLALESAEEARGEERVRLAARAAASVDQAVALEPSEAEAGALRERAASLRARGLDEHARQGRRRTWIRVGVVGLVLAAAGAAIVAALVDRERGRATRAFNEVRSLAHTFIFDFHDRIADLPGSLDARKLIVEKALIYLDRLAAEAPDVPELQHELASGYLRIGMIQGDPGSSNLGDLEGSVRSLEKAIAIAARLPRDAGAVLTEARAHTSAARILITRHVRGGRSESDADQSVAHAEAAVALLEGILARDPHQVPARDRLADALLADATVRTFLDQGGLALASLRRAEGIWRALDAEGAPTADCVDMNLSRCLYEQGRILSDPYSSFDGRDPVEARRLLAEARRRAEVCAAATPDSAAAVNAVLLAVTARAPLEEDPEDGIGLYHEALALIERLHGLDPTDARSLHHRGIVLRNLGKLQARIGETEDAAATFASAIEAFEQLADLRGKAREAAPLAMLHERRARLLIELGELDDVVAHFDAALGYWALYCEPPDGGKIANLHLPNAYLRAITSLSGAGFDDDVARLLGDAEAACERIDLERVDEAMLVALVEKMRAFGPR